jgi:hypothetical protein
VVAVIGAFMASFTGSEGGRGGNYDRLKRGELLGDDRWGSEKEGATSMVRRRERRRWQHSAGAVREEEGWVGRKAKQAGGWLGRQGQNLKENSFRNKN